jgi:hypothetical protein
MGKSNSQHLGSSNLVMVNLHNPHSVSLPSLDLGIRAKDLGGSPKTNR